VQFYRLYTTTVSSIINICSSAPERLCLRDIWTERVILIYSYKYHKLALTFIYKVRRSTFLYIEQSDINVNMFSDSFIVLFLT